MSKLRKILALIWIVTAGLLMILFTLHSTFALDSEVNVGFCFNASPGSIPKPELKLSVQEGQSKNFTVTLCSKPQNKVSFLSYIYDSANITDESHIIIDDFAFNFSVNNFDKPRTLTITVNNDQVYSPTRFYKLYFDAISDDENYNWDLQDGKWVQISVVEDDVSKVYMPIIAHAEKPTPIPPTATSTSTSTATPVPPTETPTPVPPQWQQFASTAGLDLDVVRLHQNRIFVGEKSSSNKKGIYEDQASGCAVTASFRQVYSQISVRDLYFRDSIGLAASFGNKVAYSFDILNEWKLTNSNINPFVYGVVKATNNTSFAGTDIGLYKSVDDGATWGSLNASGQNPQVVNGFTYQDVTGDVLWIYTFGNGVSRYLISANSFTTYDNGLTGDAKKVLDLLVRNGSNELYIGTSSGVYKGAQDLSSPWENFGLTNLQVVSIELIDNTLYAGTAASQGIWTRDLTSASGWSQLPKQPSASVIRDLHYDMTDLCTNLQERRKGLLAATNDGLWVYR